MKRLTVFIFVSVLLSISPSSWAINSSSVIGVGESANMGGAGVALDGQEPVSSAFLNPARLSSLKGLQFYLGNTFLLPRFTAKADYGSGATEDGSQIRFVPIPPELGFSFPVSNRFTAGMAAFSSGGVGVDFLNQNVGNAGGTADFKVAVMNIQTAPMVSYDVIPERLSIGLAPIFNYSILDLGRGGQPAYGLGVRAGLRCQPQTWLAFGASYESPVSMKYRRIFDFDANGSIDSFNFDQPQRLNFGIALKPLRRMDLALDGKWIHLTGAAGFEDMDVRDQFVVIFGMRYRATDRLTFMTGYNFGNNPLKNNSGFTGENPKTFQGMPLNGGVFAFENLRTLALPIYAEHHVTFGMAFKVSEALEASAGYEYGVKNSFRETGTLLGNPVSMESVGEAHVLRMGVRFSP